MTELATLMAGGISKCSRESILRLQDEVGRLPQIDCPVRHFFVPGIYAREIFVPEGSCVVGKIHLHSHLSVVLGDITVFSTVDGLRRITGCETFESTPGTKRGVYAHSDTWWTTFHPNPDNCTDLAELEARLIAPDFLSLDMTKAVMQ